MKKIRIERMGPVLTVTLARPEKRNALDLEMLDRLTTVFAAPVEKTDRVVVLRGEGDVFCAGIDLRERLSRPASRGRSPIEPLLHAMEASPLPVVAVVHGDAIAGGNELALHCDFVVASSRARFGMTLSQIGLAPTWPLTKKLLDVLGPVAAREMLLLGDLLPAKTMFELRAIARVAEPEALEDEARKIIDRLANNAPISLRTMKATLVRQMTFRDDIPHDDIIDMVEAARHSKDAAEGIRARLEKRRPNFTGE